MWFLSSSLGTFPFLQVLVRHFKPQKLLLVDSNVIFILAQFEQRSKKKKKISGPMLSVLFTEENATVGRKIICSLCAL